MHYRPTTTSQQRKSRKVCAFLQEAEWKVMRMYCCVPRNGRVCGTTTVGKWSESTVIGTVEDEDTDNVNAISFSCSNVFLRTWFLGARQRRAGGAFPCLHSSSVGIDLWWIEGQGMGRTEDGHYFNIRRKEIKSGVHEWAVCWICRIMIIIRRLLNNGRQDTIHDRDISECPEWRMKDNHTKDPWNKAKEVEIAD